MFDYLANPEIVVRDPAKVLGIPYGSDSGTIKRAFRARAFATHPDRGGDPEEFLEVNTAYQMILAGDWGEAAEVHRKKQPRKPKAPVANLNAMLSRVRSSLGMANRMVLDADFDKYLEKAEKSLRAFAQEITKYADNGWISRRAETRFYEHFNVLGNKYNSVVAAHKQAVAARKPPPPPSPPRRQEPLREKRRPVGNWSRVMELLQKSESTYNSAAELNDMQDFEGAQRKIEQAYSEFGAGWGMARNLGGVELDSIKPSAQSLFGLIKKLRSALERKSSDAIGENRKAHEAARRKLRSAYASVRRGSARAALKSLGAATQFAATARAWTDEIQDMKVRERRLVLARQIENEIQQLKLEADDILFEMRQRQG